MVVGWFTKRAKDFSVAIEDCQLARKRRAAWRGH
jgi:hypothetical protein